MTKQVPSEMLDIEDAYTSYCFNEAIAFIKQELKNGEEPIFRTHYSKPSDFLSQFNTKRGG